MSFETEVELSLTVPQSELRSAKSQIEGAIGDVSLNLSDGPAAMATDGGGGGGATGQRSRRLFQWARMRTNFMGQAVDLLDDIEEKIGGGAVGGGGGGGTGIVGRASSIIGGSRIGSLLGSISLAALVSKVPLTALIRKIPSFATLVTAADLGSELVTGELSASDIISAPVELGESLTFNALDNDVIEGAIGTATLTIGAVQIAGGLSSLLPSVGIGSILTGFGTSGALASTIGSVSIGAILTPLAAAGGVGLAAYLGTVAIGELIETPEEQKRREREQRREQFQGVQPPGSITSLLPQTFEERVNRTAGRSVGRETVNPEVVQGGRFSFSPEITIEDARREQEIMNEVDQLVSDELSKQERRLLDALGGNGAGR